MRKHLLLFLIGGNRLQKRSRCWKHRHGVLNVLILLFSAVAVCAAVYLVQQLWLYPRQNTSVIREAQQIYSRQSDSALSSSGSSAVQKETNTLESLRAKNADIVGWVRYPGTVINYPVVREAAGSSGFYLHHNYLKEASNHGSIFLPVGAKPAVDRSLLLYGHNMKDGQMFHSLANLTLSQLRQNPVVYFDTGSGLQAYKIFAYLKTNTQASQGNVFPYASVSPKSGQEVLQFAYALAIRSVYRFPVNVQGTDQLLLLSTCSYEFPDFRTVLAARRVRTGETSTVNAAAISASGKTLYPDCWYASHGGTKPVWPVTYTEAKKQEQLPWPAKG